MIYDVIILGAGCAGLTAGIYAGRAQLNTLILENSVLGGQAAITNHIGNYPGVPDVSGAELTEKMLRQAQSFGTEYRLCEVQSVELAGQVKRVHTDQGIFEGYSVILATGAVPRKVGFEGEAEFQGRGVGYCATCDGFFFQDKDIFVIGGGNSAAEEAIYLTRFGKKVTMLVRKDSLRCEKSVAERVLKNPKIEVKFNTELIRAYGQQNLQGAELKNNRTGEITTYRVAPEDGMFGIFVFVGYQPASALFAEQVALDENGYVITDDSMQTNITGVYAAGDVRPKGLRQLVTATADGAVAAVRAGEYVMHLRQQQGIAPPPPKQQHESAGTLTGDVLDRLRPIFDKLERNIQFALAEDDNQPKTEELKGLLEQLCGQSSRLSFAKNTAVEFTHRPAFAILDGAGNYTGVKFSGVPMGHEFNSLIYAIFNAAGPGQPIDQALKQRIDAINKPIKLQIAISLSCHFCPEVVIAAQRIALENPNVEAEMIDVGLFADVRQQYNIMSVPALIINEDNILFGAKTIEEIVSAIEKEV